MNSGAWWIAGGVVLVVLYEMRRQAALRAYERAVIASYGIGRTAAPECNCARTAPQTTAPQLSAPLVVRAPAVNIAAL
jgi:hypothetical protein